MKAFKKINPVLKKFSFLLVLLIGGYTVNANPLTYIMPESTSLDMVYVLLGISAISMLLFFPDHIFGAETEKSPVKVIANKPEYQHHRKVVKKTA